jgi:hypothetical protein
VALFDLIVNSTPEVIMPGRITTKGRIEYQFRVFGGLTVLFFETKLEVGKGREYLDAVAQLIAEAEGMHCLSLSLLSVLCPDILHRMRYC